MSAAGARPGRLGRRQVIATLLVAFVIGVVLNVLHIWQDARQERARMDAIGAGVLSLIEGSAIRAAYTYDHALSAAVVQSLLALPSVLSARVEDNLGRALADGARPPRPAALRVVTDAAFGSRMILRQSLQPPPPPPGAPAGPAGAPIGALTIEFDTWTLADDLVARSITLFALGVVKTALLAAALLAVAHMLVTRPLTQLAHHVDTLDASDALARVKAPPSHESDELGRLAGTVNALLDRFRSAETARLTADRRFRAAAQSMPDGLVVIDPGGDIAFLNDQFAANCPDCLRPYLATGRNFSECFMLAGRAGPLWDPRLGADPEAALNAALTAAEHDGEVALADGRVIRARLRPMPDGGRLLLTTDVTQSKRMAEDLRRAEKLAAVGTLAGGVAHDFNNLLATIFASTELALARLDTDSSARPALERVLAAGRRGRALVEQITAFSRAERAPKGICDLGESAASAAALSAPTLGERVRLTVERPAHPAPVAGSETQIHQLVSNLLANAAHATEGVGAIRLRVAIEGRDAVLSVSDDGVGMDEATRSRAFEPFFTTKPVGEGSGLGLAVVYGVVATLGGGVRIDSAPGLGTTITIRAPLVGEARAA